MFVDDRYFKIQCHHAPESEALLLIHVCHDFQCIAPPLFHIVEIFLGNSTSGNNWMGASVPKKGCGGVRPDQDLA